MFLYAHLRPIQRFSRPFNHGLTHTQTGPLLLAHLSKIAVHHANGFKLSEIARMLSKNKSTISRELTRNTAKTSKKIKKIKQNTATLFSKAIIRRMKTIPSCARRSIPYDNGLENVLHKYIND